MEHESSLPFSEELATISKNGCLMKERHSGLLAGFLSARVHLLTAVLLFVLSTECVKCISNAEFVLWVSLFIRIHVLSETLLADLNRTFPVISDVRERKSF